jgi:uncharacterized protein YkwD
MTAQYLPTPQPTKLTALLRYASILVGGLFASSAIAQQTLYSHGDPTALEQQMLEYVNQARLNPTQEGVFLNSINTPYSVAARAQFPAFFTPLLTQFASYPAVPPLAFNPILITEARQHSQDMVTNNYFSHTNLAGQDPTQRAAALGYSTGVGENLDDAGASTEADILEAHFSLMMDYANIDNATDPLGHRLNILDSSYTEVGVGVVGPLAGGMITQEFGEAAKTYILGVAYLDANANGSYDVGEGLSGITVTPASGNWYTITSTSGGYAIPVDPVQTVTGTVNVPYPVQTTAWATIQPYDTAYRQQQLAAAPNMSVNLTWSGGTLAAPVTTAVTMKTPVLVNYQIVGTDGWVYNMTMVTSQNVKTDFTPAASSIIPPKPSKPLGNLKSDGTPNFIFQNSAGQVYAWFLDGSGNPVDFAAGTGLKAGSNFLYPSGLGDWRLAGVADVNGDGIPDLIFQNSVGQVYAWFLDGSGNTVNFSTGAGLKATGYLYGGSLPGWQLAGIADVNGDGIPDLVFQNTGSGQVYAFFLDGSGASVNFTTGSGLKGSGYLYGGSLPGWQLAGVADVNGDGIPDLVFQNTGSGQLYVFILDGSGASVNFTTGSGIKPGSKFLYSNGLGGWQLVAVGDVNGDGNPDLIFQNGAGQIYAWFLDGSGNAVDFGFGVGLKPGSGFLYTNGLGNWRITE